MGIIADFLSITAGALLGAGSRKMIRQSTFSVLGISVMIISLIGFIENVFRVAEGEIKSVQTIIVVFSLIAGTILGDILRLSERLIRCANCGDRNFCAVTEASLFFGIGGMQITGPVLLATTGDSSQLIIKSLVDFPFALMFGASYGRAAALSAIPVAALQCGIFGITLLFRTWMTELIISQLCSMGYVILFLSGCNFLIREESAKFNTVNMLPSIVINLCINLLIGGFGV